MVRREVNAGIGQVGVAELVDSLRTAQVAQAVNAEVAQADLGREPVKRGLGRALADEDVARRAERAQPGAAVDDLTVVVAVAELGEPSVDPDPQLQADPCRPRAAGGLQLQLAGAAQGIDGVSEGCENAVALAAAADQAPGPLLDCADGEGIVLGHHL